MPLTERDAQTIISGLAVLKRDMALLHEKLDLVLEKEDLNFEQGETNMAVTQADVDALRARIQADNATQTGTLQQIKDDFAALQAANPTVDLSGLSSDIDQLDQNAAAEQQVASDNQPPAPSDGGTPAS